MNGSPPLLQSNTTTTYHIKLSRQDSSNEATNIPIDRYGAFTVATPGEFHSGHIRYPFFNESMEVILKSDAGNYSAIIHEDRKKRFEIVFAQLERCKEMESGWDSYDAEPPSEKAINFAGTILDALKKVDFLPSCVCPSVEGGVGIAFVDGDAYADIECFNDGEILAALTAKSKSPTIIEIDWENLDSTINMIRKFLQSENTRSNDSREQETGSELF